MAMPVAPEARVFYRAAVERVKDARFILDLADRTTAAVYLGGYAVECMLKALILSQLAADPRKEMLGQFRGSRAHDYDWLKLQYRHAGGPLLPRPIQDAFVTVNTWGTELRYNPRTVPLTVAVRFLVAVERIFVWADGRL